jgi:hypothetical protein
LFAWSFSYRYDGWQNIRLPELSRSGQFFLRSTIQCFVSRWHSLWRLLPASAATPNTPEAAVKTFDTIKVEDLGGYLGNHPYDPTD